MVPARRTRTVMLLGGLVAVSCVAGCAWFNPEPQSRTGIDLVGGNARVLSVDKHLGCITVATDHGTRTAFWNEYTEFVRGEQRVRNPGFKPGDQFVYHGFEGDREIYLRRVLITTQ